MSARMPLRARGQRRAGTGPAAAGTAPPQTLSADPPGAQP